MKRSARRFALAFMCSLAAANATYGAGEPGSAVGARLRNSFEPRGQAGMERLTQDMMQATCSKYEGKELPEELSRQLTSAALAAVRFPKDAAFFGDWRRGEQVAKTGTGLQSSDDPSAPSGGNCYACHQLAAEEIAFGTLGPSLTGYGALRGTSEPMLKYTWTRLWNSHAYNACSHMPRFGDAQILTEQQIKDVMAYLFDPASPVNAPAGKP